MEPYECDVIFTLEARSNIFLSVMTEEFQLSDSQVFQEIITSWKQLKIILSNKEIEYSSLKHALTPTKDKNEIAFVFDWTKAETNWYGKK